MMQLRRISFLACLILALFWAANAPVAEPDTPQDIPRIALEVPDTTAPAASSGNWLKIYLSNFADSVEGVQFELLLDRPDLMLWDLTQQLDTTGTLLSGWEFVTLSDPSGSRAIIRLTAIADFALGDTAETPGFGPQQGGTVIKLPFISADIDDTVTDRTCNIRVKKPIGFSDANGQLIGQITDTLLDTIYLKCTLTVADTCAGYKAVNADTSDYDSVHIYPYLVGYLDTTAVIWSDGSITLEPSQPMPCDFNDDAELNITDLTCMVGHLFMGQADGCPTVFCDCNGSGNDPGEPNVADLTCMVDFLFRGGPPPDSP